MYGASWQTSSGRKITATLQVQKRKPKSNEYETTLIKILRETFQKLSSFCFHQQLLPTMIQISLMLKTMAVAVLLSTALVSATRLRAGRNDDGFSPQKMRNLGTGTNRAGKLGHISKSPKSSKKKKSEEPSAAPSDDPSSSPSAAPSPSPSVAPSDDPSSYPSAVPTRSKKISKSHWQM